MTDDVIFLPPFSMPAKPKYGDTCNGCGFCCHMSVCGIGQHFFPGEPAPCPGIVYHEGIVRCGVVLAEEMLMENSSDVKPQVKEMLAIGWGCDSTDPRDRP